MEYPKPMYKADEANPKYVNSLKEQREAKEQGWQLEYIHRDWPKGAWDQEGNFVLAQSEEDAIERGLSFEKPEAVPAAASTVAAFAARADENTSILQSLIDGLERRLSDAEVKIADLEDRLAAKRSKKDAAA